jgi:CubicO group peptidase (beta-lactamase class C family)
METTPARPGHQHRRIARGPRQINRPVAALSVLTGLVVTLAACGGGTIAGATTSSITTTSSSAAGPEAYVQCMRAHGVPNFPDPVDGHITLSPSSGIDPTSPAFQAASNACAALAPSGPAPGASTGASQPTGKTPETPATSTPVTAATWKGFGQWLATQAGAGQFSGAALVARKGRVLLDAGYGQADRAGHVANTAQTTFCVASIGKLFTAVAIAQLAQDHKLAFDDTLGKYLTGFAPAVADRVTIADLLDMTSGLGDVALSDPHPPTTLAGQIKLIAKEPLQSAAGSKFLYSNDGYIVLGAIIQRITGHPYTTYVDKHVLQPAGITHTDLDPYTPADVSGMAHGYTLAGKSGTRLKDISGQLQIANPSGGASSTVGDLYRFAQALLDHKLLTKAMTATVLTPRVDSPQPGGPTVNEYTYGFAYQAENGVTFVGHNGGTPGYEGQIDIYPSTGYVVVILTNQDQALIPAIQHSEAILTNS